MSGSIKNPWGDGRDAAVLDDKCVLRPCLQIGENKGSFSPGRGYTSYYKVAKLVCMRNHCHGCPHPLPEPDPEKARCCPTPDFPTLRAGARPYWQRCRSCKKRVGGLALEMARTLSRPAPTADPPVPEKAPYREGDGRDGADYPCGQED